MALEQEVVDSQDFKDAIAAATSAAVTAATEPLQNSITNLESTNVELKGEKTTLAGEFNEFKSKFEGIDVDAMRLRIEAAESDEVKQMLAAGEYEKLYERDNAKKDADHTTQLDAVNKRADDSDTLAHTLRSTVVSMARDGGIDQAFIRNDADSSQLRAVKAIAKDTVLVKGEEVPVVEVSVNGQSTFRHSTTGELLQNAKGDFDYTSWLVHLAEVENLKLFAKPNSHSNPNAISEGNPKGFVKTKMTDKEKVKFKKDNGIPAYNKLPYS